MILPPLCLSLLIAAAPQTVDGLREGESATNLVPRAVAHDLHYGRVIDAMTGQPLEGATIEAWTEEIDEVYGGFHRIASARTGQDGRYQLRRAEGGRRSEKVRVSAPGYATLSAVGGDQFLRLFPVDERIPRMRFLDVDGRPIEGVRVTSTYSCAHDVPAFEYRSDVRGELVLSAYALQDNLPELRVLAPGYRAIKYISGRKAIAAAYDGQPMIVHLGRIPGASVRLLDEEGQPLALQPIHTMDGDGYHVDCTDEQGRLPIPTRYESGELTFKILGQRTQTHVGSLRLPGTGDWSLRQNPEGWPSDTPTTSIVLQWIGVELLEREATQPFLLHEDGWAYQVRRDELNGEPIEFPAGRISLLTGEAFSGFEEQLKTVDVEPGGRFNLLFRPQWETLVNVSMPEGIGEKDYVLTVQSGTSSILAKAGSLYVPSDEPLVFLLDRAGIRSRLLVASAEEGANIDLRTALALPSESEKLPAELVRESLMTVEMELSLASCAPYDSVELIELEDGGYQVVGPRGSCYLLRARRSGHSDLWRRGRLGESDCAQPISSIRMARLRIEPEGVATVEGMDEVDLGSIHPGPLDLVLRFPNGNRLGVSLALDEGADRTLRVQ